MGRQVSLPPHSTWQRWHAPQHSRLAPKGGGWDAPGWAGGSDGSPLSASMHDEQLAGSWVQSRCGGGSRLWGALGELTRADSSPRQGIPLGTTRAQTNVPCNAEAEQMVVSRTRACRRKERRQQERTMYSSWQPSPRSCGRRAARARASAAAGGTVPVPKLMSQARADARGNKAGHAPEVS